MKGFGNTEFNKKWDYYSIYDNDIASNMIQALDQDMDGKINLREYLILRKITTA